MAENAGLLRLRASQLEAEIVAFVEARMSDGFDATSAVEQNRIIDGIRDAFTNIYASIDREEAVKRRDRLERNRQAV